MDIRLPDIVAAYFVAEKAKDSRRVSKCFHENAVVRDEKREHQGVAAIEAWHRDANKTYRYVVEPIDAVVDGSTVVVRTRVSGDFPGNVAQLRCTCTVSKDRIASLEIRP